MTNNRGFSHGSLVTEVSIPRINKILPEGLSKEVLADKVEDYVLTLVIPLVTAATKLVTKDRPMHPAPSSINSSASQTVTFETEDFTVQVKVTLEVRKHGATKELQHLLAHELAALYTVNCFVDRILDAKTKRSRTSTNDISLIGALLEAFIGGRSGNESFASMGMPLVEDIPNPFARGRMH